MNCYQNCYYQCNNDAVTELIKRDTKLTVKNIANSICIPQGSVHKILIQKLKLREGEHRLNKNATRMRMPELIITSFVLVTKTLYAL